MNKFIVVIPARYKSSRLPGKPLVTIAGMSLIERTWRQCLQAADASNIIIATDDDRIVEHCRNFGAKVELTSADCKTGTDRVATLLDRYSEQFFINVQGDEPLLNPDDLKLMINEVKNTSHEVINGYCTLNSSEQFFSPHIPKVVVNQNNELLYMSRAGLPAGIEKQFQIGWRQVCIYGFSRKALESFYMHGEKTPLENVEDIEILRFLEMGYSIKMLEMSSDSIAVDLPEDVKKVEQVLQLKTKYNA